jgi:hypothetical protein
VFALGLARHGRLRDAIGVARAVTGSLERFGSPVECYVALDPVDLLDGSSGPLLARRQWPPHNRVQAFSAAAMVVFGALLEMSE